MAKLIMLRGIPASGKSTWAREYVKKNPGTARVNKDDLRDMMHNGKWSRSNEKAVLSARDNIVTAALKDGNDVIVDDTNLAEKHHAMLGSIADMHDAEFEIKDFGIGINEAIKRNWNRPKPVPEKVIRRMFHEKRGQDSPLPDLDNPKVERPPAAIFDIDGTLAHMVDRHAYDWDKVGNDIVDPEIAMLTDMYYKRGYKVLLVSGRDSVSEGLTREWLDKHKIDYTALFMRPAGNVEPDYEIKRMIFETHIHQNYDVRVVVDDRSQTVLMWRHELGLKVLQVDDGEF